MKIDLKYRLKFFGQSIILFFAIFDVSLNALPTVLSSRKIIFILTLVLFAAKGRKIVFEKNGKTLWKQCLIVYLSIFCYIVLISIIRHSNCFSGESVIPAYMFFMIYTLVGTVLIVNIYDDEIQFLKQIMCVMLLQSVFIFFEYFSIPFKEFLTEYIRYDGNVAFSRLDRGTGLGTEGSNLTLLLFLGVFACNYLILKENKIRIRYVVLQIVYLLAMLLVGRLGIFLSGFLILYTSVKLLKKKITAKQIVVILGIGLCMGLCFVLPYIEQNGLGRLSVRLSRFFAFFDDYSNDPSIVSFRAQTFPTISINTLIGYGVSGGIWIDNEYIRHDSGYIQFYIAVGLIVAILFYLYTYITAYKVAKQFSCEKILFLFLLMIIICEVKEPYILRQVIPTFYMGLVYLKDKNLETRRSNLKCETSL